MRNYYLVKAIYKENSVFLIWYSDNEDRFLSMDQNLVTFQSPREAGEFAEAQGFLLDTEISVYDFSHTFEYMNNVGFSENCSILLNIWNFFSDLSRTLNEEFAGDSEDGLTEDIYDKLFYGSNLKAINNSGEEYHPEFDEEERMKCESILQNGLSVLVKALFAEEGTD